MKIPSPLVRFLPHKRADPPSAGTGEPTPFELARDEWDQRWQHAAGASRNWRLMAILHALLALVFAGGWILQVKRTHLVPYLVLEREVGDLIALGQARPMGKLSESQTRAELAQWIEQARSVTTDQAVQKLWVDRTWAFLSESGAKILEEYYHRDGNNPYQRQRTETASVSVTSIHPLSDGTWQIRWSETVRSINGSLITRESWQAVLAIHQQPPKTLEAALINPAGLLITHLSWAREMGQS